MKNILRDNWYFLIAAIICVAAFGYKVSTHKGAPNGAPVPVASISNSIEAQQDMARLRNIKVSPKEQAIKTAENYTDKVSKDPTAETAPGYLLVAGNLYHDVVLDFASAAQMYERILSEYPDAAKKMKGLYYNLADCYERLEQPQNARRIYQIMMENFPSDSAEYQYAHKMLYKE